MKLKRILFRFLVLEILAKNFNKLLIRRLQDFQVIIRQWLVELGMKVLILFIFIGLAQFSLLFGLGALALYLNEVFGSSYQGFLAVSGGCVGILLLLLLLRSMRYLQQTAKQERKNKGWL